MSVCLKIISMFLIIIAIYFQTEIIELIYPIDESNYYKILGLSNQADYLQIKNAFKKLSIKYHPDKNDGKTLNQYQKIVNAYENLIDKDLREKYDNEQYIKNEQQNYERNMLMQKLIWNGQYFQIYQYLTVDQILFVHPYIWQMYNNLFFWMVTIICVYFIIDFLLNLPKKEIPKQVLQLKTPVSIKIQSGDITMQELNQLTEIKIYGTNKIFMIQMLANDSMQQLYKIIDDNLKVPKNYVISQNYPKILFERQEQRTLQQLGMHPQIALFLYNPQYQ